MEHYQFKGAQFDVGGFRASRELEQHPFDSKRNIYKYYLGWKLMTEREAARTQLKQTQAPKKQTKN
jgi:hypothetical protein